ncbi:hypothetical protein ACI5FR_22910 [Paenibacillus sp. HJGM_3]
MTYQHYPKQFDSFEEALAYLKSTGKLQRFGVEGDSHVYNFHANTGKYYHMLISNSGLIRYVEMSPMQYAYWREQGF